MQEISAFQRDILWAICLFEAIGCEPTGSHLQSVIDSFYPNEVYNARFYPNINTLHEKGLVEKYDADGRTKVYPLTDAGREHAYNRGQIIVEIFRLHDWL